LSSTTSTSVSRCGRDRARVGHPTLDLVDVCWDDEAAEKLIISMAALQPSLGTRHR
jgi:hypothetical protein